MLYYTVHPFRRHQTGSWCSRIQLLFSFHPTIKQLMEGDCDLEGCSALDLLGRVFLEGGWTWWCCCSHLVTYEESCSQESLYQRLRHGVCRYKMFPLRRVSLDCGVLAGSWERGSAKAVFSIIPTLSKACVQSAAPEAEPGWFLGCMGSCVPAFPPSAELWVLVPCAKASRRNHSSPLSRFSYWAPHGLHNPLSCPEHHTV